MKQPPSRLLRKTIRAVVNENEYLDDLHERKRYLDSFHDCINSPFGTVLINSLESLEKQAMEKHIKSIRRHTANQAKAEIKTARYLLNVFRGMLAEKITCDNEIDQVREFEEEQNGIKAA